MIAEPEYFALPLAYYARDAGLAFPQRWRHSEPGLRAALDRMALDAAGGPVWVVIEKRSAEFHAIPSDPRLSEVDVRANDRAHLRLFRVRVE